MRHRPKLAASYSHQPEVPESAWPPVKKTQYINLALIRTEQASKEYSCQTICGDIMKDKYDDVFTDCLLYTSPSPRDATLSRMPSSA